MTHLITVDNPGINRYIAKCICGWYSLTWNNAWAANMSGKHHLDDQK